MTEREKVLLRREGAVMAYCDIWACAFDRNSKESNPLAHREAAEAEAARLFPLPTRTVPTVRQGPGSFWYRVAFVTGLRYVERYGNEADARNRDSRWDCSWPPEDQPTVAALLALPLTEEVEDTGEDGAK